MSSYGKTITHESVSFRAIGKDKMFGCFGNWFNTKDQEIGAYYNNGRITLEGVKRFLLDHADMTCSHGCGTKMLELGTTTYEVEVARFWDNEGGTDDIENLGRLEITRNKFNFNINFIDADTYPHR